MTPNLLDLGRRAVKCKRWRWLCGASELFLDDSGEVYGHFIYTGDDGEGIQVSGFRIGRIPGGDVVVESVPDLSDPATLGCLLALVREAWGDERGYACPDGFPGEVLQQIDQKSRATYAMLRGQGDGDLAEELIDPLCRSNPGPEVVNDTPEGWYYYMHGQDESEAMICAPTEAAALVLALEAAP